MAGVKKQEVISFAEEQDDVIDVLKNEKVIVRFIPKRRGLITDPKHLLFGGMAEGSKLTLTTPLLKNGGYANVLTTNEKNCLERKLGLEPNALSVHNTKNNFWSDANPEGVGRVSLIKGDNVFDLSDPMQYIKYKVVIANKDVVASSIQVLQINPKVTYKFVALREDEVAQNASAKVSAKAQAYMEFGKINEDKDKLKLVIETLDGRPVAENSKLEYLQGKVGELIEANTSMFLKVIKDPLIDTKILIRKAISKGIISNRGNYLYMRDTNTPLCENGEEPTLNIAANYLSKPKYQELRFSIEAKVKD